jgi:hypothetical protein
MSELTTLLLDREAIAEGGLLYCVSVMRAAAALIEYLERDNTTLRNRALIERKVGDSAS